METLFSLYVGLLLQGEAMLVAVTQSFLLIEFVVPARGKGMVSLVLLAGAGVVLVGGAVIAVGAAAVGAMSRRRNTQQDEVADQAEATGTEYHAPPPAYEAQVSEDSYAPAYSEYVTSVQSPAAMAAPSPPDTSFQRDDDVISVTREPTEFASPALGPEPDPAPAASRTRGFGASPLPEPKAMRGAPQDVDVSVYAPPQVRAGHIADVQLFFHAPHEAEAAEAEALKQRPSAALIGSVPLMLPVRTGDRLRVTFECGFGEVDQPIRELTWHDEMARLTFLLNVPRDAAGHDLPLKFRVFINDALAGRLEGKLHVTHQDGEELPPDRLATEAVRFRKPFFSYASPDRVKMLEVAQVYRLAGIDCWVDVLSLSPGQRWEKQLYRKIDECDAFLLFWSRHARNSEWVIREAEYVLERNRRLPPEQQIEICPVILEGPPIVMPPDSLNEIHFNDPIRMIISAHQPEAQDVPADADTILLLVRGDGGAPLEISRDDTCNGETVTIGRDESCSLYLPLDSVSRRHAAIGAGPDGRPTIQDLGSSNGTFVDDQRIGDTPCPLTLGQTVRIGDIEFRVGLAAGGAPSSGDPARPSAQTTIRLEQVRDGRGITISMERLSERGALTIGRDPGCRIVIDNGSISREHAELARLEDGRVMIRDLGSSNGTFVDGNRLNAREFVALDGARTLKLGEVEMSIEFR